MLNNCWVKEIMPDEMEPAEIMTLYKKGNVEDPPSFRPIGLLHTIYIQTMRRHSTESSGSWTRREIPGNKIWLQAKKKDVSTTSHH